MQYWFFEKSCVGARVEEKESDSDGSTASSVGAQRAWPMQVYPRSVQWDQDPLDDSDSDEEYGYRRMPFLPQHIHNDTVGRSALQGLVPEQEKNKNTNTSKKYRRPCKGKRLQFRKMIDELKERVQQEQEHFDVESIQLASDIAIRDDTLAKIKTMIAKYREQVLANVDVPDLDAKPQK